MGRKSKLDDELMRRANSLLCSLGFDNVCYSCFFFRDASFHTPLRHFHSNQSFHFQSTCRKTTPLRPRRATSIGNTRDTRWVYFRRPRFRFSRAWIEVPPSRKLDACGIRRISQRNRRPKVVKVLFCMVDNRNNLLSIRNYSEHDEMQLEMIKSTEKKKPKAFQYLLSSGVERVRSLQSSNADMNSKATSN